MQELNEIQVRLKAPKDLKNNFANFVYRNASGILEAIKPLLKETKCTITLTDSVEFIGERFYTKSTATIKNAKGETESAVGYAREADEKKGNDPAQISGACSSYARKYALCGLLAIDDSSQDPDSQNNAPVPPTVPTMTKEEALAKVASVKSKQELTSLWNSLKATYAKDADIVLAIKNSPFNPKSGRSNGTK